MLQSIRMGVPVPSKIADAPDVLPWLRPVYTAFADLHTCRVDTGPIPWTAIYTYAKAYGYDKDEAELTRFTRLIRGMDRAFMEKVQKDHKRLSKRDQKPIAKGKK